MTKKRYKLHDDYKFGYAIQDTSIPDRVFLDDFNDIIKELNRLNDMNCLIEDEIGKKITLLIDAKIQCFQSEDEELLGKINFGIQILNELKEVIITEDKRLIKRLKEGGFFS